MESNHARWAFGLTLALFAVSYLTVGWWTDSYQSMYDTVLSGELTGYHLPTADPFPEYMPGAAYLFTLLGRLWPIKWVAIVLNALLFLSLWALYFQIIRNTEGVARWNRAMIIIFLSVLFFESVVLYHMVRITMFLGIAGLSNVILSKEDDGRIFTRTTAPYLLLFMAAMWVRCNVHLFVLMFVTVAFIVHRRSLLPLVPYYVLLTLFLLYYFNTVFWTDYSDDLYHSFLYDLEFRFQHVWVYEPTLRLNDALDSLKYQAVRLDFFGDEHHLNHDFFVRTGMLTNHSRLSYDQFLYAVSAFRTSMTENIYFLVADVILVTSYLVLGGKQMPYYRAKTIVMFGTFYALLLAISFIKMENRFMVPFQILFLLTMMFMHRPKLLFERGHLALLTAVVALYLPLTGYYTNKKLEFAKNKMVSYERAFSYLSNEYSDHTIVFNTVFITFERPFGVFDKADLFNDFFVFNYYSSHLSPAYRPYVEEKCQCDIGEFYSFYRFLKDSRQQVVLLDYADRITMLERYLHDVNGYSVCFEELPVPGSLVGDFGELGFREGLSVFKMVK